MSTEQSRALSPTSNLGHLAQAFADGSIGSRAAYLAGMWANGWVIADIRDEMSSWGEPISDQEAQQLAASPPRVWSF